MAMLNSSLMRSLLSGIAGFVAYGGWAYYVNVDHGADLAMMIGLVQGSYSFVLTFVMTLVTESLYKRFKGSKNHLLLVMITVCAGLFTTPYVIHMFIGTPEILMTILPGFVIGMIYTWVYVLGLKKADRIRGEGFPNPVKEQKQEGFHERRSAT